MSDLRRLVCLLEAKTRMYNVQQSSAQSIISLYVVALRLHKQCVRTRASTYSCHSENIHVHLLRMFLEVHNLGVSVPAACTRRYTI